MIILSSVNPLASWHGGYGTFCEFYGGHSQLSGCGNVTGLAQMLRKACQWEFVDRLCTHFCIFVYTLFVHLFMAIQYSPLYSVYACSSEN
jgi:hypothetical protein